MAWILRRTLLTTVLAAVAVVGPGQSQARAQVSFRGAGYFGGSSYWGGGYYFERFSIWSWHNPFIPSGFNAYGYGYGLPYFGFNPNVETYPYLSYAQYPIFSYIPSSANASRPKVIELSVPTNSKNTEAVPRRSAAEDPDPVLSLKLADPPVEPTTREAIREARGTAIYRADQTGDGGRITWESPGRLLSFRPTPRR